MEKSKGTTFNLVLNGIELCRRKPTRGFITLDSITYTKLVQSSSLVHGQLAHCHMIKTAFKPCLFLINNLLSMYSKHGRVDVARQLFETMPKRNIVSYNLLVDGYRQMGFYENAIDVFNQARVEGLKLDKFTFAGALNSSAHIECLVIGKVIHGLVVVNGLHDKVVLVNALIDMYGRCGRVDFARVLFENSDELDEISWNSLIKGYVRTGENKELLRVLVEMHRSGLKLNSHTLGSVLKACCTILDHSTGKILHGCIVKLGLDFDIVVGTALLDMYMKNRQVHAAIQIFESTPNRNVVMYTAMISGFVQLETADESFSYEAFPLFSSMLMQGIKPSKFTFSSILKACNHDEAFEYGKQIHAQICKNNFQSDEFIGSALTEFYSLSGSFEDCLKCFSLAPELDIVSRTSMISCCIQNGQFERGFSLFYELLASKLKPDEYVISRILSACAKLSTGRSGEQIHGYVEKTGLDGFKAIQNSLISMYAKSGDINSASKIFNVTENPDVVSWSAMIHSNAQHGFAREALDLFELMNNRGLIPNQFTFLGVLAACSHGGLVDEGLQYYESMKKDYGITPNTRHYASVVDLLARAEKLDAAETFILNSGFDDNPVMWQALLSACRVYKDIARGKRVSKILVELEPQSASSYTDANAVAFGIISLPKSAPLNMIKNLGVREGCRTPMKLFSQITANSGDSLRSSLAELV
ncbi:hypothetical protein ACFE04_031169 [Oxalis oulophora]